MADLFRMLDRKLKPRTIARDLAQQTLQSARQPSAHTTALLQGLAWHEEVDKHFHRQDFFLSTQAALLQALKQAKGPANLKRLLPAHVLAEFWFDCHLVKCQPLVLKEIQQMIRQTQQPMQTLLSCLPHGQPQHVDAWQQRIIHPSFYQDFCHTQGPLQRMNRMLPHFGMRTLSTQEQQATHACWLATKHEITPHLDTFVTQMQQLAHTQAMA